MSDQSPPFTPEQAQTSQSADLPDSQLWGVSLRGWIVTLVIGAMCLIECARMGVLCFIAWNANDASTVTAAVIREPMYSVVLLCIGAYFGKRSSSK